MEIVKNRKRVTFIRKDDDRENFENHLKLTFNGILYSYTSYDSYTFN